MEPRRRIHPGDVYRGQNSRARFASQWQCHTELLSESQLAPQDARTHQSPTDILLTMMRQRVLVALLLRACSSMRTPQAAVSRRSIGGLAAAGVALRPSLPVLGQRCMRAFELRAVFVDARRVASSTA